MNCQICGKELTGKQRKYCSEDCVREGKNNSVNVWRNNNKETVKDNVNDMVDIYGVLLPAATKICTILVELTLIDPDSKRDYKLQ